VKILFETKYPFAWAHGGNQIHVEMLMSEMIKMGIECEPLKWWDDNQQGDVLCLLYNPTGKHLYAKKKGIKIVTYVFLDAFTSKGKIELFLRKLMYVSCKRLAPGISNELGWNVAEISDAFIYPCESEIPLGKYIFGINTKKSHAIIHGVDNKYLDKNLPEKIHQGNYLVTIGTIHPRKNSLYMASIAKEIKIPIVFIGRPYSNDDYYRDFLKLVDNKYVIYNENVNDEEKFKALLNARGYIMLSNKESGCIAVLEALALKTPVFLPDFPWARGPYNGYVNFGSMKNHNVLIKQISEFYTSPQKMPEYQVMSWKEVAKKYVDVFQSVLDKK
jgi:glycosyltransferase involved in cell wall biosynthesis